MADQFIYCPQCGGKNISDTDYEDSEGEIDNEGRACDDCSWEGSVRELVCED